MNRNWFSELRAIVGASDVGPPDRLRQLDAWRAEWVAEAAASSYVDAELCEKTFVGAAKFRADEDRTTGEIVARFVVEASGITEVRDMGKVLFHNGEDVEFYAYMSMITVRALRSTPKSELEE